MTVEKWALIFFMVYAPQGIEKSVTYQRNETNFHTLSDCQTAGNDRLAVIDVPEGYNPSFACVPIDAIDAAQKKKTAEIEPTIPEK
jgi:hypothetical protein